MRDLEFGIKANDRTQTAFESAEARAKRFNGELDKIGSAYGMASTAAKAFAGAFALTAVAQFGSLVRDVIGEAADLVDLSDKIGMTTDEIQRLQYGFKLAGMEADVTNGILSQWVRRLGEAYTHGGKLADVFKANGISLTDGEGKLRSTVDLMRDYSDLMARAGSSMEQQVLSALAFGKANDEVIVALGGGKAAFDKLMAAADKAGGVLNKEVLQTAADIDDEFDRLWRTFELGGKSAILSTVALLNEHSGAVANFFSAGATVTGIQAWVDRGKQVADIVKGQVDTIKQGVDILQNGLPQNRQVGRLPYIADPNLAARFDTTPGAENDALVRKMIDMYGKKTIIPGDETRTSSTKAATEQVNAYQKVIDKLREEQSVLGMNATEQKIVNEQRQAGVTAVSAEGIAIAKLVTDIERQTAATKSLQEQTEFLKSSTSSFFTTWRHGMQDGEGVAASFFNAVGGFADTLASKMEERFASSLIDQLMGTVGGNGFSLLAPLFGGSSFPAAPKVGLSSVIGQPGAGSMIAPAAKMAATNVRIEQKIPASIQVAEEDDGAGGKRLAVMIDEENAASLARPGSRSSRAMRSRFGVKQRLVKR